MAIVMNAKGTTSPYFKIGKQGTNIFQGSADPASSYTTAEGDLWVDTSNKIIKFRNSGNSAWVQGSIDITGNVTASGDLTINGTTTILDTVVQDVDQLVIGASNATYAVRVNQTSSGDILQLQDGGTTVMVVEDGGSNVMVVEDGGIVGIGFDSPAATLDVTGTDAMIVPKGTTAQRPGTPESGMVRFNTTTSCFEGYNGSSWVNLGAYS